ncbi:unnamed protein product [Cyprideis torosa]|uniref:Uncharacterized protein n=1 Tax=Cyprideis torosa TaxID=163714 RepID=A0A7R8WPE8_9CRUS|nr:unnamed protein product [Cyprideis torosa]CAG0907202.1 unnamed protein product [Cyprideis torosa]
MFRPIVKLQHVASREQKQKTVYKKDECNPVFDDRFTWAIPQKDMRGKSLEMVVMSRKSKMSKLFNKAPLMGRIEVDLGTVLDSNNHLSAWMDLEAGDSDSED